MSSKRPKVRLVEPERRQGVIRFEMPEDTLAPTHLARVLWQSTSTSTSTSTIRKAVEGHAGRPVYSPRMLLSLWLYAISRGVGSAREIARLVESDRAYRWLSGDNSVSHHLLSRFRVGHGEVLERLMADVLGIVLVLVVVLVVLMTQQPAHNAADDDHARFLDSRARARA